MSTSSSNLPRPRRRLRAALTLLAASAATAGLLAVPTPASADDVSVAEARVAAVQREVEAATRTLTDGTRRWEADRAALKVAQRKLARSQRAIAGVRAESNEAQVMLDGYAASAYRNGTTDVLMGVFTDPDTFLEGMAAQADLAKVTGGQGDALRGLVATKVRAQQAEREVAQLAADAAAMEQRAAADLVRLKALAASTASKLESAQAELAKARAAKAARIAAEAARRAALARASRARAQAQAQAAVVVPRVTLSGPQCTGRSTEGQSNGNLDPGSLCPLWMAPGQSLRADAANAFNAMSKAYAAQRGSPICVTDSYRSYSDQASLYRSKPGLAAVPGTSNHGWGQAVDLCGGMQSFGTAAHDWMRANAGRWGWRNPEWAQPGQGKEEPWHWEFGT